MVVLGPRWMQDRKPFQLKWVLVIYNGFQVALSGYMFYEFLASAYLAGYNLSCQPVDFTVNPLSLRVIQTTPIVPYSSILGYFASDITAPR